MWIASSTPLVLWMRLYSRKGPGLPLAGVGPRFVAGLCAAVLRVARGALHGGASRRLRPLESDAREKGHGRSRVARYPSWSGSRGASVLNMDSASSPLWYPRCREEISFSVPLSPGTEKGTPLSLGLDGGLDSEDRSTC